MRRLHGSNSDEKQDVEEVFARMPQRRPAAFSFNLPSKITRTAQYYPPPAPRLRRGPERSRDDALTGLGNIPILKPYQALHASTDDENESGDNLEDPSTARNGADSAGGAAVARLGLDKQSPPAPPQSITTPPGRSLPRMLNLQLPSRFALHDGLEGTHFAPSEEDEEALSPTLSKHQDEVVDSSRDRTAMSEDAVEGSSQNRSPLFTDGFVDTESPTRSIEGNLEFPTARESTRMPDSSPMRSHQVPETQPDDSGFSDEELEISPRTHLRGFWDVDSGYTFKEHMYLPQTEPRRRPQRASPLVRTNSESILPIPAQLPLRLKRPVTSDLSTNPSVSEGSLECSIQNPGSSSSRRPVSYIDRTSYSQHDSAFSEASASRQYSMRVSSGASSGSLPYSFYELPDSRHSSSDQSQEQLYRAQFDGAAHVRQMSRGAYYSIRLPHNRPTNDNHLRSSISHQSNHPSLNMPGVSQRGASPLPADPYTSPSAARNAPGPPFHLTSLIDPVDRRSDAANAAARNLSSPLELLEERANSYLTRIEDAQHSHPRQSQQSTSRYHETGWDTSRAQQGLPGPSDLRYQFAHSGPSQTAAGHRRLSGPGVTNISPRRLPHGTRSPLLHRRAPPDTGANQRSSENVPVAGFEGDFARHPRPNTQGQNFGQMQHLTVRGRSSQGSNRPISPIPPQYRIAHSASPQGRMDTTRLQPAPHTTTSQSSPRAPGRESFNTQLLSIPYLPQLSQGATTARMRAPPVPSRIGTHQRGTGAHSNPAYYHDRPIGPPPSLRLHPIRTATRNLDAVNTPMNAQAVVEHQRARRRRLSRQQQDQENSGTAEAALMRQEMEAGGMRYSQGGQLEVMDETPPRLGRFEQRTVE